MSYLIAHGSYGRDTSGPDWLAGKDFKILNGPYFSIRDVNTLAEEYDQIMFIHLRDNTVKFSVSLIGNPTGAITPVQSKLWPWVTPVTKLLNKDPM